MKNKKLYFVTNFTQTNPYDKVSEQVNMFNNSGFDVTYIDVARKNNTLKKVLSSIPFINLKSDFSKFTKVRSNSCIYIRYFGSDYKFISYLRKLRRNTNNVKIAIEIPTYPYDGEVKYDTLINILKSIPNHIKDKVTRRFLYKYVDRIVTYSDDKSIFRIKTINISNGVNLKRILPKKVSQNTKSINMIAVAKFGFWHGYDRLIKGLGRYYNSGIKNKRDIKLYLVGPGDSKVLEDYKLLIKKYKLYDKVILTGKKYGKELARVYDKCELGIDSLARYRSGVTYNSTLKGKEYLAKGLPIISGVKTELDNMQFKYYYRVPADDSPINIKKVIEFYDKIYQQESKQKVINEVRSFCSDNFSFNQVYKKVINWYKE